MARLIVSPLADSDSADILALLKDQAGAEVAQCHRRDLEGLFERLAMFPDSGVRRRSLGSNVRIGVVAPYVVVYLHRDDTVEILRILDGRRNITRRLVRE